MHCIDWDGMAKAIYGEIIYGATPAVRGARLVAYDETVEFYEYDLDLAKQLLADAGYPTASTPPSPSTRRPTPTPPPSSCRPA